MAMKFELIADFVGSPELGKFCKAVWEVSRSNLNHTTWSTADYNNIYLKDFSWHAECYYVIVTLTSNLS